MVNWLRRLLARPPQAAQAAPRPRLSGLFTTEGPSPRKGLPREISLPLPKRVSVGSNGSVGTMDDDDGGSSIKPNAAGFFNGIPEAQLDWYASQSFIGYNLCAIISQHWLVYKACAMPGKDAVRKWFDLTINNGTAADTKLIAAIKKTDKRYKLKKQLTDFVTFGRVFGIRHALFLVDNGSKEADDDWYSKPFNIDGVKPGSYKGISQIDPYWIVPLLTETGTSNPANPHFYEPEFWNVSGRVIHRSHFAIFTTGEVPDVLKTSYYFGGVSITQRIFERVYASERSANEAPQLAMTKRLTVMKTDLEAALADQSKFNDRMEWWTQSRDNYGVKFTGADDEIQQFDLTLTDLDSLIMTQYQLVAACAEVPGTKLLGTQPKGFNSTGNYEEASYHETLETLQANDLDPFLDRHYALVLKSDIGAIATNIAIEISWNELDAMTALEQANVNLAKAQTDQVYLAEGAIDASDVRQRITTDPASGYNGLSAELPPMPDAPEDDDSGGDPAAAAKPPAPKAASPGAGGGVKGA